MNRPVSTACYLSGPRRVKPNAGVLLVLKQWSINSKKRIKGAEQVWSAEGARTILAKGAPRMLQSTSSNSLPPPGEQLSDRSGPPCPSSHPFRSTQNSALGGGSICPWYWPKRMSHTRSGD